MTTGSSTTMRRLPYRWELVAWLWLAFFFNQADRQLFNVVLPQIRAELGLSDVELGLVATTFTFALAVMVPIAGFAGDRLSRRRLVIASVLGWSLATLLTGFGTGLLYLIVVRSIATGVGEGVYAPSANALIGAHHLDTRARAMAIYQTSLYVGIVASGAVGGAVADRFGWRAAFWTFGGAGCALAGLLAWRLRGATPATEHAAAPALALPSVAATTRIVLGTRTVRYFLVACCGMIFVNVGYLTWMPSFMYERFGLSLAAAGFSSMFAHHVFAFAGVLAGGWLSDRHAASRPKIRLELQGWALLLGAPFLLGLGLAGSLTASFVALAGFGFCRGVYDSNTYPVLFSVVAPRLHASASGLVIAVAFVVGSLAPVVLALMKGAVGLAAALSSLSVLYLLGGATAVAGAARAFAADALAVERASGVVRV